MFDDSLLEIEDLVEGDRHTLQLVGKLDRASVPIFDEVIRTLLLQGTLAVSLDLGNLTDLEPVALRAVFRVRKLCAQHGCDFSVVPLSRLAAARSSHRRTPSRSVARPRAGRRS
jgi:anti-anti-sigma regulatory factor